MSEHNIQRAAERLAGAIAQRATVMPIRDLIDLSDVKSAYEVQAINVRSATSSPLLPRPSRARAGCGSRCRSPGETAGCGRGRRSRR